MFKKNHGLWVTEKVKFLWECLEDKIYCYGKLQQFLGLALKFF